MAAVSGVDMVYYVSGNCRVVQKKEKKRQRTLEISRQGFPDSDLSAGIKLRTTGSYPGVFFSVSRERQKPCLTRV